MKIRRVARPTISAVAAVLAVSGVLGSGVPAQSAPSNPAAGTVEIKRFDGMTLKAASRTASGVPASDAATRSRIKEHLDDAARNGRLIDETRVRVTSVMDPFTPGEAITLVWDSAKAPEQVLYSRKTHEPGNGHSVAMGVEMGGGDTTAMPTHRKREPRAGSGYSAVFGINNMYLEDNGCSTTWFAPTYSSDRDHKIVSCYEAWGLNRTPIFVYNRWALWTVAPPPWGLSANTVDMEVSARPWKGHEWKIKQLADWAPRNGDMVNPCDTNRNFTLTGGWGGISGSVTMPINTCSRYWLNITAGVGTQNRMTIDFDGSRSGQMYMDIAGKYDAVDQYVLPYWADRNYMQVRVCTPTVCGSEYWAKQDSGW